MTRHSPLLLAVLAPALLATFVAGCVEEGRPADCDAAAVTRELTLTGVELGGDEPAVCRDQEVTLRFTADGDGVLHIHGYDAQASAAEFIVGESLELTFTASLAGQFPIEVHTDAEPEGLEIGILTVHER